MTPRDATRGTRVNGRSRGMILGAIRAALADSGRGGDREFHELLVPVRRRGHGTDTATAVDRFAEAVAVAGGSCVRVATTREATDVLFAQLERYRAAMTAEQRLKPFHVGMSDASIVDGVLGLTKGERKGEESGWTLCPVHTLTRDNLFALDAGITGAQWGIAETGTLVLDTAQEHNRLLSLVPPIHVAILSAARIRDTCADVLDGLWSPAGADEALRSGAITLITGPSRTSDIELTLVLGVHGPQQLYVIVIDEVD